MPRSIEVALLPAEAMAMEADCFIVVDVLRATTTMAALFGAGLARLTVADEIDLARRLAAKRGALLFGEVGGLRPPGFDYGNSPVEAATANVLGREAVLFTTNGTRALCALAARGGMVAAAAALNAGAAARLATRFERTAIVCAGDQHGRRFALEDLAAAGLLVKRVLALNGGRVAGEAALLAAGLEGGNPGALIASAHHAQALRDLALGADVEAAAMVDTVEVVPVVVECGEGWATLAAG